MNNNLNKAKKIKNDEFYTDNKYVNEIINNFKIYLKDKIIYCNCDDYRWSEFYLVLKERFVELELKELYASNLDLGDGAFICKYNGINENITQINNGSFDSEELLNVLQLSDIVMTNPPFSIKIKYVKYLESNNKDYILILPETHQTVYFDHFKNYKVYNIPKMDASYKNTNTRVRTCIINTFETKYANNYNLIDYDNFDDLERDDNTGIVNINKIKDIPNNYYDYMYVPVTLPLYDNVLDYDIIKVSSQVKINGKLKFKRFLVKKKINSYE